ncbi:hypothetical protein H2200_003404 [Cladophialophora chaetospira]|uniref:Uncharacterized protein n=1 Tax=Cladophialophora chaetospira TaxID=386627 RepID=A0AA39CM92_9EURO|nr:hypothetical protein H2200_003404 [Cladophialophora chaetospira]
MLALQRREKRTDIRTANILPCRIQHDGPLKVTKRYWSPQVEKDGTATSYFRGRKLRGKVLKLPAGYRGTEPFPVAAQNLYAHVSLGVVAKSTDRYLQPSKLATGPTYTAVDEDIEIADEEEEPPEPVKILEETSGFEEIIVWGHDIVPTNDNPFVKGIEEWISFAEAIHGTPNEQSKQIESDRTKAG